MIGWPVRSLVWRIVLLQALAVSAGVALVSYELSRALEGAAATYEHPELSHRADVIARGLHKTAQGWTLSLPQLDRALYQSRYEGYAYEVRSGAGPALFSSVRPGESLPQVTVGVGTTLAGEQTIRRGKYLEIEVGRVVQGIPVRIRVVQDLSDPEAFIDDIEAAVLGRAAWWRMFALLILTTATWLIVKRAVGSMLAASEAAKLIAPERIDVRLPVGDVPSEVRPLIVAVNNALDRLAEGYRRQAGFAADVAHELRTPLAVMRARTEELTAGPERTALQADIDGLGRTLHALLAEAEADSLAIGSKERVDLGRVLTR